MRLFTAFPLPTLHPKVLLLVGSELLMALLSKCLALTGIIAKIIVFQMQCITNMFLNLFFGNFMCIYNV